jgi:hypothetical protein
MMHEITGAAIVFTILAGQFHARGYVCVGIFHILVQYGQFSEYSGLGFFMCFHGRFGCSGG